MRRIKLIDLINMHPHEILIWISQFKEDEQEIIINQVEYLRDEAASITHASYDNVNHTVLMAAVLITEIGI